MTPLGLAPAETQQASDLAATSGGQGRLWFEEIMLLLLVGSQDGGKPAGGQLHVLIAGRGKGEADVGAGEGRSGALTVRYAARQHHHTCLCQLHSHHSILSATWLSGAPLQDTGFDRASENEGAAPAWASSLARCQRLAPANGINVLEEP